MCDHAFPGEWRGRGMLMTTEEWVSKGTHSGAEIHSSVILGSDTGAPRTRQMSKCLPRSGRNTSAVVISSWHSSSWRTDSSSARPKSVWPSSRSLYLPDLAPSLESGKSHILKWIRWAPRRALALAAFRYLSLKPWWCFFEDSLFFHPSLDLSLTLAMDTDSHTATTHTCRVTLLQSHAFRHHHLKYILVRKTLTCGQSPEAEIEL